LSENEIISLLLLGAVGAQDQEGGVVDFGTALIGKTPLQTKLQDEFGVDVSLQAAQGKLTTGGTTATGTQASSGDIVTVPKVKVQKEFTRKTKLSVSSTLGETLPERELKIEHFLNDNFTVNATAGDKNKSSLETQQTQSYGIDFRYKFDFE
jgi:hypothetical protein